MVSALPGEAHKTVNPMGIGATWDIHFLFLDITIYVYRKVHYNLLAWFETLKTVIQGASLKAIGLQHSMDLLPKRHDD